MVYWFTLPHHSLSLKKVRAVTQTSQEPGGRSRCRGHEGVLFTGLCLKSCPAGFLILSTGQEVAPLLMGWALPHKSLIKTLPCRLTYRPTIWHQFLKHSSFSLGNSSLYQVDIELASKMTYIQSLGYTWLEGETQLQQIDLWPLYIHLHACAPMHTYTK